MEVSFTHALFLFFFFKQKTAYELRISDWSSDVCSSDLRGRDGQRGKQMGGIGVAVDQPVAHRRPALIADKLQLQALVGRKTQFMRQYGNGRIHQRQIADPHGGCRHCPSPSSSSATISAAATSPMR